MSDESKYISVGKEQLHYLEWGNGKGLLLVFHGYGDDAGIFTPLRHYLEEAYTILSIDLPHHGKTEWNGDVLGKKDLIDMVHKLMDRYDVDKVSLIGYSMGGRVCLTIIEHMPASIDKVVLMATDGLTVNLFHYFFTRTFIGRGLFRNLLDRPARYLKVIEWMKKRKIVDTSRYKFVMHFLGSAENRQFLQKVWPNTSELIPAPAKVRAVIRKYNIPVSIFMGVYDKIIPASMATKFSSGMDSVEVIMLEKGHRVFDNETAQQITEHLL